MSMVTGIRPSVGPALVQQTLVNPTEQQTTPSTSGAANTSSSENLASTSTGPLTEVVVDEKTGIRCTVYLSGHPMLQSSALSSAVLATVKD